MKKSEKLSVTPEISEILLYGFLFDSFVSHLLSLVHAVLHRKDNTPPDSLVLCILQQKQFSPAATEWGIQNEAKAIMQYIDFQHANGHFNLMVTQSGFLINKEYPFLGASPDGAVYDLSSDQPFGFLEVKCPYSYRICNTTASKYFTKFLLVTQYLWKTAYITKNTCILCTNSGSNGHCREAMV